MSKFFEEITPEIRAFIENQKIFFVATAPRDGHINLSPKGMDTFRVLDTRTAIYLDLTGSGNETAAHLIENGRITIMFCSFDKAAMIMRLYGRGRVIRPGDPAWENHLAKFPPTPGVRQIMEISVERAMNSCGYAVPRMTDDGLEERETLRKYWLKEGANPDAYQRKHNVRSIDGLPTGIPAGTPHAK
jgi:Pyridoxamine 5'-phosphate oxidase